MFTSFIKINFIALKNTQNIKTLRSQFHFPYEHTTTLPVQYIQYFIMLQGYMFQRKIQQLKKEPAHKSVVR